MKRLVLGGRNLVLDVARRVVANLALAVRALPVRLCDESPLYGVMLIAVPLRWRTAGCKRFGKPRRSVVVQDLGDVAFRQTLSTPAENLTDPPIENLTDRRGDEPQAVATS